MTKMTKINLF